MDAIENLKTLIDKKHFDLGKRLDKFPQIFFLQLEESSLYCFQL